MHSIRLILIGLLAASLGTVSSLEAQAIKSISRASLAPSDNKQGKSYSYDSEIDGSGQYVIFTSTADNFAADGKVEGKVHEHLYLRDVLNGTTTQVDVTSEGKTGSPAYAFNPNVRTFGSSFDPHISRNGKYIVFTSSESNISPDGISEAYGNWAYLKNLETGVIQRIPYATAGDYSKLEYPTYLAINADGSVVVVVSIVGDVSDTNGDNSVWEMTVYNRGSNTTTLINTGATGNKFNPGISDDGRYVVFENQVGDFNGKTYSYLYDLTLSQLTPLNGGNVSESPAISGDGSIIAYTDMTQIFLPIKVLERESSLESVITNGMNGEEANGISDFASLSIDGRYIAFLSDASNLVKGDSNDLDDIFVYDRTTGKTTLVSVQGTCKGVSSQEDFNTGPPAISSDGKTIAFTVLERLIPAARKDEFGHSQPADTNTFDDVYVAELDYDAEPSVFAKNFTPATPFATVNCKGTDADIQVEEILTDIEASKLKNGGGTRDNSEIKKINRQVIIKKTDANGNREIVRRTNAKKNQLTFKNLPPGNYTAQVVADAKLQNGRTNRSRYSRPAKFTITK